MLALNLLRQGYCYIVLTSIEIKIALIVSTKANGQGNILYLSAAGHSFLVSENIIFYLPFGDRISTEFLRFGLSFDIYALQPPFVALIPMP